MNIQQIEYILAVAELRNFGQAADKCFITQSTLSTMVKRFENEISIPIFDRKTKPITITKEGEAILNQLKLISKEITILEEIVQTVKGELSGELKIGVIPTIAPYILPHFLNGFASKFPQLTFAVSEITTGMISDFLLKRELDIGIVALPLNNDNFIEIPLYNEPFVLYDCTDSKVKKFPKIEELNFDHFWLLEEGHCLSTQVKRICDFDGCKSKDGVNFDFKAGSIDSLIRFVKMERGLTLLPYLSTLDFPERERKNLSEFRSSVPVRTVGLVVHKHFVKKQIIELLQREIQEKIQPLLSVEMKEEWVVSPF